MAKRKRRIKSPHPGVKLRERSWESGASTWYARWSCPDSGRETDTNLSALGLTTREARVAWARAKAQALAQRRAELEAGAPRAQGKTLAEAWEWYASGPLSRLREGTREVYSADFAEFMAWAGRRKLGADDLDRALLVQYTEWLATRPRANANDTRGKRRSAQTTNKALRSIKAVLNALRRAGLVPRLDRDAITDGLKLLRAERPLLDYLAPPDARALLKAARLHDAECFRETRDEHAGLRERGTTPRYEPVAPLLAFMLLSGCRDSEARELRWDQVDLGARDERGLVVGEVRLGATAEDARRVKTGRGRVVDLAVAPALLRLLRRLKLRAGDVSERPYVFGGASHYTRQRLDRARQRLARFGAPAWGPQRLRRTCATALVNSSIWGGATVWRAAKQLGHSPAVLEKHYAGLMRVDRDARTVEAVLGVEGELSALLASLGGEVADTAAAEAVARG